MIYSSDKPESNTATKPTKKEKQRLTEEAIKM